MRVGSKCCQVSSLDCYKVANLLEQKLSAKESDKTRLRTCYVLEALLKSDIPGISECISGTPATVLSIILQASFRTN